MGAIWRSNYGRKSFLVGRKLRECCLSVHAVTSMDDAIDMTRRLVFSIHYSPLLTGILVGIY